MKLLYIFHHKNAAQEYKLTILKHPLCDMAYYVFISAADLCVIVCQMFRGSNPPFSFFPPELNLTDKCLDGALNNNNYESEVLQVRPSEHVRYCNDVFCVSFLFGF